MLFADLELARRLEMTDALAAVEFARAWASRHSYEGEVAIEIAGGWAGFAGIDSPVTQAFGLGLNGPVAETDMDRIEEFYRSKDSAVNIETCPLADVSLLKLWNDRGYRAIEHSNVFVRQIERLEPLAMPEGITVRMPLPSEIDIYTDVVAKAFFENIEISPEFFDIIASTFYASNAFFFLAEIEGAPAGGGMMSIHRGVASLGGAGTLPAFRMRGVQRALIDTRLAFARERGCDLAMIATMPGTQSQRNVERNGFRVVYTRTKVTKDWK